MNTQGERRQRATKGLIALASLALAATWGCASHDHRDGDSMESSVHYASQPMSQPDSQPASQPASQPTETAEEAVAEANAGRNYVEAMIAKVGSLDDLKAMGDVEYTYTYRDNGTGKEDVSIERYVFDGEYSWATFTKREKIVMPQMKGELVQGYDGESTWVTLDGILQDGGMLLRMSDFLRKTNFYWLTMMQKLLDPGTDYAYEGTRTSDGIEYDLVRITYGEGVGDAQDTYLLYLNPETHLVDRFLFTVMDFGRAVPNMMKVKYETFGDVMLPTFRSYASSNWDGEIAADAVWTDEICENLKFGNGFTIEDFRNPSATGESTETMNTGEAK